MQSNGFCLIDIIFMEVVMTKSSVVSLNESLEAIEAQSAEIRLALMQRDIEAICDECDEVERVDDDSIAIYTLQTDTKYQFGMLVGYFDGCWWSGIVLFKTDDIEESTSDKLQSTNKMLEQTDVEVSLSSEHYVYVDSAGIVEREKFSEFVPKMLESIKANESLLIRLNRAIVHLT